MLEQFENYIRSRVVLTQEEWMLIRSKATVRKLRRRQYLLQEGDICRHKTFVTKGLLTTYLRKEDGSEYIMRFTAENDWFVDPESYHNLTPVKFNTEALEDTTVVSWTKEQAQELFSAIPSFRAYSEALIQRTVYANQDRILKNISSTSEEKYQDFITSFPDVFPRVPLHMVASYLGVSRETLSRIRHAQWKQLNP